MRAAGQDHMQAESAASQFSLLKSNEEFARSLPCTICSSPYILLAGTFVRKVNGIVSTFLCENRTISVTF